jgi:ubiquinone/menaquinone biosynthesis C-methylase UbiE
MGDVENTVADYYERIWSRFVRWWQTDKTLCLHYAIYDENARDFKSASINTNKYVEKLLKLDKTRPEKILDAGCGVGGASIYLAKKYPNNEFTGITITPGQKDLAIKFAKERKIKNVKFQIQNYLDTNFPENYFDKIFALESACYASDKKQLVKELNRILKPGGRLVIVDAFFTKKKKINPIMQGLHDLICYGRGMPINDDFVVEDLKKYLQKGNFKDIKILNLTRNVFRSQLRSFTIGIPFLIQSFIKFVFDRKYDASKDPDFYIGASVLCGIYGFVGSAAYYAISTDKK